MKQYKIDNYSTLHDRFVELLGFCSRSEFEATAQFFKLKDKEKISLYKGFKLLKTLNNLKEWSPKWEQKLQTACEPLGLKPVVSISLINSASKPNFKQPGFYRFVEKGLQTCRALLNLKPISYGLRKRVFKIYSTQVLFENLSDHFDPSKDHVCNLTSTFFLSKDQVLPTQTTPLTLLDNLEKNPNILDYFKVFRRESRDKTHLCEFHQLEYRKWYPGSNPLDELVRDLECILRSFGLKGKIQYRKTRYTYTSPSLQIFYYKEPNTKPIELGGSGIFRPEIIAKYTKKDLVSGYWLAAGIGLERIYCLISGKTNLSESYRTIT